MLGNGGYDHQFYNIKELDDLDTKEINWQNYLKDESNPKPEEFTLKDEERRDELIAEGWSDWNKKDFFNFVKMAEVYGRNPASFECYREALPQKTAELI